MAEELKAKVLHKLVIKYVGLSQQVEKLRGELTRAQAPLRPERFYSLAGMQSFASEAKEVEAYRNKTSAHLTAISESQQRIGALIAGCLSVSCAWLKVGKYGVGKYWDASRHISDCWEVQVEEWREKLPPLYDRSER